MGTLLNSSNIYGPGRSSQAQQARPKRRTASSDKGLRDEAVGQHGHKSRPIIHSGKARQRRHTPLQVESAPSASGPRSDSSKQLNRSLEGPITEKVGEGRFTLWPTPSEYLLAAMGPLREKYEMPESMAKKPDISYVSPISMAMDKGQNSRRRRSREIWEKRQEVAAAMAQRGTTTQSAFKRSLPSLLGKYMELVDTVVSLDSSNYGSSEIRIVKENYQMRALPKAGAIVSFLHVFNDKNLAWLSGEGYDVTDLTTWDWILTAESAERAAIRLTVLAKQRYRNFTAEKPIPTFVLLFLLRRQDVNSRCLKLLLEHALDRLLHQGSFRGHGEARHWSPPKQAEGGAKPFLYPEMSEPTIFLVVVRLLRQARKVWPAAMVRISAMMTKYIGGTGVRSESTPGVPLKEQTSARLTFLYNKMLSLLALPSNLYPFESLAYHQQAQFIVLKRMNEFQPPLIITREGYQGVIDVQLRHKKTPRERQWAAMKALSWPPWKEEKLGIDRDIGVEHGISRASEALLRARESGYARQAWEDVAGVSAGWDTDRSPTIQTRAIIPRTQSLHRGFKADAVLSPPVQHVKELWAARIRATRTVDEAWACFLASKNLAESQPAEAVYYAMFEKLIFEAKRIKRRVLNDSVERKVNSTGTSSLLPGDCKETFPVPGPREAIYVRTPTPDINEHLKMMVDDKIKPSGRFLAFLWDHAGTFEMGLTYLRESSLDFSMIQALIGRNITHEVRQARLKLMEDHLFASFIAFLSRSAPFTLSIKPDYHAGKLPLNTVFSHLTIVKLGSTHMNPLLQAFQLMEIRKPYYRPPWNALLSALARPGRVVSVNSFQNRNRDVQDALTWKAMCDVLSQMEEIGLDIDFSGFQILCVGLEKAILASRTVIRSNKEPVFPADGLDPEHGLHEENEERHSNISDAEQVLSTGVLVVKPLFKRLVAPEFGRNSLAPHASEPPEGLDSMRETARLPKLLEVPSPAQLHAFVRVLGHCGDYAGILELVQWMGDHMPELMAVANESMNGLHNARRCAIAIRVFLERSWPKVDPDVDERDAQGDQQEVEDGAPCEIVEKVVIIMDENKVWGGWPTDEEVTTYCRWGGRRFG